MNEPAFHVAIPARFGSTRLPGKPLRDIDGRPMIELVHQQAVASGAQSVVIATDDQRIQSIAEGFGAQVVMTRADHLSGTDRIAEVAARLGWPDDAIVVNLQGDEPHMPPALLGQVARALASHPPAGIATLCTRLRGVSDITNPNVVKVVCDSRGYALYFSRAAIPWNRDDFAHDPISEESVALARRHLGLYAYRASVLRSYPPLEPSPLERLEHLEQLRALWHGIGIVVEEASSVPPPGIDTEEDLAFVNAQVIPD